MDNDQGTFQRSVTNTLHVYYQVFPAVEIVLNTTPTSTPNAETCWFRSQVCQRPRQHNLDNCKMFVDSMAIHLVLRNIEMCFSLVNVYM